MESFVWDKNFETGLPEIDQQHNRLIDIINQFGNLISDNELEFTNIKLVFKELGDYANYHFREEHALMTRIDIDPRHLETHLEAHQNFLQEVTSMHADISPDNLDAAHHLFNFLTHWLAYHILGTDKNMARQIKTIQSGASSNEAYEAEELKVESSTEPLLVALNGLFQQISLRNKQLVQLNKSLEAKKVELSEANINLIKEMTERAKLQKERQEIQNKVMIQDKLATLGQVATGVAHELNQPLTYITTIIQTTIEKLKKNKIDKDKLIKKFEKAAHQASRILDITTHLRTVGRGDDAKREEVDLSAILDDSLVLMNEKLKLRNISLNANIPEAMPVVLGIYNKLEQIFINLTTNAIDALEKKGGGEINVEMIPGTDTVVIRYSDNGNGMPPDVRDKIFEPFFTTKERGKGTGLGMAIINDIIVDHNGTITCESEQDKGTTFTITFPIQKVDY